MANSLLAIPVFFLLNNEPYETTRHILNVPRDANVVSMQSLLYVHMEQWDIRNVVIIEYWKPRSPLSVGTRAGINELRTCLSKHIHLEAFCEELFVDNKPVIQTLEFDADNRAPPLVVEIRCKHDDKASSMGTNDVVDMEGQNSVMYTVTQRMKHLTIGRKQTTPSNGCNPIPYRDYQQTEYAFLDGRYGDKPLHMALPIEVYHPSFACFREKLADQSSPITADIMAKTIKFINLLAPICVKETERTVAIREALVDVLDIPLLTSVNSNRTQTDHTYVTRALNDYAALLIIEEKSEIGSSGDPSTQGSISWVHYWGDNGSGRQRLRCMTRCPTFIVSIAGPWISISGAVLTSHSTVQRLTDFIWLGRARAYEETKCIRIARVLQALKHGLRHLDAWYKKLRPSSLDNYAQYLLVFPAITFYPTADADVQREFRYTRKLKSENDPACTSFLAQAIDGEHQLVVKFVDRYDEHAHQLLAGQGLAPTLLYCGNIWPNEAGNACRPLRMVVMDYVSDMCTLDAWLSASVEEHGQILDEVEKAVRVLHDHNYVHGDIRSPNILVGRTNNCVKIMLIDFDWSGKEGMVSYPYDLNDLIKWPEGVQNLGTIQKEHDLFMLDRLRNH